MPVSLPSLENGVSRHVTWSADPTLRFRRFFERCLKGHSLMEYHQHPKNTTSFHTIHYGEGSGQQDSLSRRTSWEKGHCQHPHISVSEEDTCWPLFQLWVSPLSQSRRGIVKCLKSRAEGVRHVTNCLSGVVFAANGYRDHLLKQILTQCPTPPISNNTTEARRSKLKLLFLPYAQGIAENIQHVCRPLGVKVICSNKDKLTEALVKVKDWRRCGVWSALWSVWPCMYISEKQGGHWRMTECPQCCCKMNDWNYGITVHGRLDTNWTGVQPQLERWKSTSQTEG